MRRPAADTASSAGRALAIRPLGPLGARTIIEPRSDTTLGATSVPSDDAALVARVLDGDQEAFRQLVERESRGIIRACYRVLGDLHEAEDAAQEAFVTAYRSLATWRGEGPFAAWLTRIAVRIALRTASRRRPVTWIDPLGSEANASAAESGRLGIADDPATHAIRTERDTRLREAVAALDEPYREVVALRFFGDLSLAEIAAQTARPLGTVKTHLHRGLARMRAALEAEAL